MQWKNGALDFEAMSRPITIAMRDDGPTPYGAKALEHFFNPSQPMVFTFVDERTARKFANGRRVQVTPKESVQVGKGNIRHRRGLQVSVWLQIRHEFRLTMK